MLKANPEVFSFRKRQGTFCVRKRRERFSVEEGGSFREKAAKPFAKRRERLRLRKRREKCGNEGEQICNADRDKCFPVKGRKNKLWNLGARIGELDGGGGGSSVVFYLCIRHSHQKNPFFLQIFFLVFVSSDRFLLATARERFLRSPISIRRVLSSWHLVESFGMKDSLRAGWPILDSSKNRINYSFGRVFLHLAAVVALRFLTGEARGRSSTSSTSTWEILGSHASGSILVLEIRCKALARFLFSAGFSRGPKKPGRILSEN